MKIHQPQLLVAGIFLLGVLNSFNALAQAPIITKFAGGGTADPGNGGSADSVFLSGPSGLALDAAGNLFIVAGNSIKKVDAITHIITTVAGGGNDTTENGIPADSALLYGATALAIDHAGNLFIADAGDNRIKKVTVSTGLITVFAGNGIPGFSGDGGAAVAAKLNSPFGVAIDDSGNVFIADRSNNRIRKVTASTGIITTVVGKTPANNNGGFAGDGAIADSAELAQPVAVALDAAGNIYIADELNNRVRKVTKATNIITTLAGTGNINTANGGYNGDGGLADTSQLSDPRAIAIDNNGNIYISDAGNARIRKVSGGIITTYVGTGVAAITGDGGRADSAQIEGASGLAVDTHRALYLSQPYGGDVRKVYVHTTGVNEVASENSINVYPVPNNGMMTVVLKGKGNQALKMYDMLGKEICFQPLSVSEQTQTFRINVIDAPSGIYLLQVKNELGVVNSKVVIQK